MFFIDVSAFFRAAFPARFIISPGRGKFHSFYW
jgi:hypothetical protein